MTRIHQRGCVVLFLVYVFFILVASFPSRNAFAIVVPITVTSDITVDTIWESDNSPVTVTDADFIINPDVTLTIDPGVIVYFAGSLTVRGTLTAVGTLADPITFDEVNPGDKWGIFKAGRVGCGDPHNTSTLQYVDMLNMEGYIYVDRQSITMDSCNIVLDTASRYGITAYNNNAAPCPGAAVQFNFTYNNFDFTTSYTGGGVDAVEAIRIDGVNSDFTGNWMMVRSDGAPYYAKALYMEISNTDDYTSVIDSNFITLMVGDDTTTVATGVELADGAVDASIDDNIINIAAPRVAYGIKTKSQNALRNAIMIGSDYAGVIFDNSVYGIYSESTDAGTLLQDNKITLTSNDDRALTGILLQAGTISGNRLILDLSGTAGSVRGLWHQYYPATIVNNSALLNVTAGLTVRGAYFATKFSTSTTTLKNNIFVGNGESNSTGFYIDPGYAGVVDHSYNVIYDFDDLYFGLSAGIGELNVDPLYLNPAELTLFANSPALDKGDWESAYGNELAPNGGRIDMGGFGNNASGGVTTVNIVAPEITTNAGANLTVDAVSITLDGSTSTSTNTVWVNGTTTGVTYTAGQVHWSYTGALANGVNNFSVLAKNGGGQSSATDTIQVTSSDLTAPLVTTVSPLDGAVDVAVDAVVSAEFSEDLDGTTLTNSNFTLNNGATGNVAYAGGEATFTPDTALTYATEYTATLGVGIHDTAGNPLSTDYSWSFTTTAAPEVVVVSGYDTGAGDGSGSGSAESGDADVPGTGAADVPGTDDGGNTTVDDGGTTTTSDGAASGGAGGCSLNAKMQK